MRKSLLLVCSILLLLVIGCSEQFSGKFSYEPEKPQLTDEITVKYDPTGTLLESSEQVSMLAYQFTGPNFPTVKEIAMEKKRKGWIGSFSPDDSAVVIFVNFADDKTVDNNDKQGYQISLFNAEGDLLDGAHGALAFVCFSGAYPVRINRDLEMAMDHYEKAVAKNPDSKNDLLFIYWNALQQLDKQNGVEKVKVDLDSIASQENLSLDEMKLLADWYSRVGENEKAEKYAERVVKAEPKGEFAQNQRFSEFQKIQNPDERVDFYLEFKKEFPESKQLDYMASVIVRDFTVSKQYDKAEEFIEDHVSDPGASMLNSVAWDLAEKGMNLETAAKLAKKGVEAGRNDLEAPLSEKPSFLTEKQWRQNQQSTLGYVLDTYAYILYQMDKKEEALPYYKEAVDLMNKKNTDVNERYAQALLETGNYESALEFAETLLKDGQKSAEIENIYRESYTAVNRSEEDVDEFLDKLREEGIKKLKAEIEKEMLNKPAPAFSLEDMEGQTVSLADLKGKIVIIDFWATWCGPCIKSFPGMQKAVDKFKDDDTVKFLFINTWERGDNVKAKVAEFINKNDYTFHVLFDSENKVVTDYGVEGIPTKFIIDKKGQIRFESVGFGGDEQKLVDELSLMIDMLR